MLPLAIIWWRSSGSLKNCWRSLLTLWLSEEVEDEWNQYSRPNYEQHQWPERNHYLPPQPLFLPPRTQQHFGSQKNTEVKTGHLWRKQKLVTQTPERSEGQWVSHSQIMPPAPRELSTKTLYRLLLQPLRSSLYSCTRHLPPLLFLPFL